MDVFWFRVVSASVRRSCGCFVSYVKSLYTSAPMHTLSERDTNQGWHRFDCMGMGTKCPSVLRVRWSVYGIVHPSYPVGGAVNHGTVDSNWSHSIVSIGSVPHSM